MKAFFKEKGLYLFCLALVFAATVTGIVAIRSVVRNVADLTQSRKNALEEDATWNAPDTAINNPVTDLPESTSTPSAPPSGPESSSGASAQPADDSAEAGLFAAPSVQPDALPKLPTDEAPINPFSGEELVYNETLGDWRTHNGADYAVTAGAAIPAIKDGTVLAVYEDALWGQVVEMSDKSGALWKYCGLADVSVKMDDKLSAGDTLGTAGIIPSESSLGAHLHLEVTRNEEWLDPETEK